MGDRVFNLSTLGLALVILALLFGLTVELVIHSMPSIRAFGLKFLISTEWDPTNDQYGALPFIYARQYRPLLALLIAVPLALGVALCLSEMAPAWLSHKLGFLVELLAAIRAWFMGCGEVFVLGPWLRDHIDPILAKYLGFLPFFQGPRISVSMFTAAVVLAIRSCRTSRRCVPTFSGWCRKRSARRRMRLGATKWEMVRMAVLPFGVSGVIGAVILGLGRALGETIAVAMVIGIARKFRYRYSCRRPTLASVIANEFVEATST